MDGLQNAIFKSLSALSSFQILAEFLILLDWLKLLLNLLNIYVELGLHIA